MDNYRLLDKFFNKKEVQEDTFKNIVISYISKTLVCALLFIVLLIVVKFDSKYKEIIYNNVYEKNFSFAKVNELYRQYFGDLLPFDKIVLEDEPVFNERIVYSDMNLYKNGAVLSVVDKYLVPVMETGIVVFIGEKDDYGKTVIIQQANGIDVWYGNVNIGDIKLYDYVKKGQLLGEVIGKKFYLIFQKNGAYLDYKEYL